MADKPVDLDAPRWRQAALRILGKRTGGGHA